MKKIGILTFHHADNYGALLQAYALKTVLLQQGHTVHILNYHCPRIDKDYQLLSMPRPELKDILRKLTKLGIYPINWWVHNRFNEFRQQFLTDTSPLFTDKMLNEDLSYDLFIAGSDQIFNPRLTNFDSNYFLAFNKDISKNFSYAASFGMQLESFTEEEKKFIKENLSHFSNLSLREKQGVDIVKTLVNRTAQVHIDPTLLLTKKNWKQIAIMPKVKKPYILLYLMYKDHNLIQFSRELALSKGLRLFYISPILDIRNRVPAPHITPTPQEWLGLFLQAEYVVTNSFHGFAFSVNFNKNFFLGKLPSTWPTNSRLDNLLELTGLQNRLYTNCMSNCDSTIEWASVNQKLAQERQKALNYLQEITQ